MNLIQLIKSIATVFVLLFSTTALGTELPKICAAVRGNGAKIFVHTNSLARIHELYGKLWGISGGSSGSVISLVVDSIYSNPLVSNCGEKKCSEVESASRAALLLKSFQEYPAVLAAFPESSLFFISAKISHELNNKNIDQMFVEDPVKALKVFKELLVSPQYSEYVNPEILDTLNKNKNPIAMAKDIISGIHGASNWTFDSPSIFVRPGAISYSVFADYFGRLASFYAADGRSSNLDGLNDFLNHCAVPGIGMPWTEVSKLPSGSGTCGQQFSSLLTNYYKDSKNTGQKLLTLADKEVGQSLHVLATVTQIENNSAQMWRSAREQYLSDLKFDWAPDFNDWSIAYMGRERDLDQLLLNEKQFADFKTRRARVLKNMTWRDILEHSPAEPSISRALEIRGGSVTTGGWLDSQPVQALANIGCEKVILLDTKFKEIKFQEKVSALLGADQIKLDQLFSLEDPESSVSTAVKHSAGVWCTNWNDVPVTDMAAMSALGWNGSLETVDPLLLTPKYPYKNIVSSRTTSQCF